MKGILNRICIIFSLYFCLAEMCSGFFFHVKWQTFGRRPHIDILQPFIPLVFGHVFVWAVASRQPRLRTAVLFRCTCIEKTKQKQEQLQVRRRSIKTRQVWRKTRVGINPDNSSWICRRAGSGSISNLCLFAFGLNQEVIQDELFGPIRGLACLVFAAVAAGGWVGCNHSSRGGGPWRLIGNGPPVNVNGNQRFKSALIDSIHRPSTQDKLSKAVTLAWSLPPQAPPSPDRQPGPPQTKLGEEKKTPTGENKHGIPKQNKRSN